MNLSTASLLGKALFLKHTLGIKSAAGFLRNRDVPVEVAAVVLGRTPGYRKPLCLRLQLV